MSGLEGGKSADRLRDAVGGVLRAWKGAGGSGGLSGLERALRGLERAYGAVEDGDSGEGSAVLGYGYRVVANDPEGRVYALRWGAGQAGGAITGVIGPIEGVPPLPMSLELLADPVEETSQPYRRRWDRRTAAVEALPDPGSLDWEDGQRAGGFAPGDVTRVRWAREQSWRFVDRSRG